MKTLPLLGVISMLAAPLAGLGQVTTVFNDTFASGGLSTLNPTATSPGTLTSTRTAYEIGATKNISSGTTIASGVMTIGGFSTASAYGEAQAVFANSPITLNTPGQSIEVYYVFTDTTTLFNGNATNNECLGVGLYYSGGIGPTNGTGLWNSGISTSSSTTTNGCTKGWQGYIGNIAYNSGPSPSGSGIYNRPAQTVANNSCMVLGPNATSSGSPPYLTNLVSLAGVTGQPLLTVGSKYTVDLKITYVNSTTLAVTNTLYVGSGNTGSVYSSGSYTAQSGGNVTGASLLTPSFDSLCISFRPTSNPTAAESLQANQVTVISVTPTAPSIAGLTNQTVIQGSNTVLSATVVGVPAPGYQWYLSTDGGATSNAISGATSSSYALNNVQYSQNNYIYSLVATNSLGANAASMTLSVIVTPSITGLTSQAASVGDTANISPTVTGVPAPNLQWQYNGVNLTDGLDVNGSTIAGSATSSLFITNSQAADSGTYSLIASNSAGIVTNSMYLTVGNGNVLPILTGPTNITVIQGSNGAFSVSVSGIPTPTVQWLDQTGTPIADATGNTLVLSNVQYSQNGYVYSCVASNSVGSVTNSANLTVWYPPVITSEPGNLVVTNTQAVSFTVAANGVPNPTYQWYKNSSVISSAANNSATNATFTIASAAPSDAANYYVLISNGAGSTNSVTVTLAVNSTMSAGTLSPANGATGVCYDTPLYLTFSSTPTLKNTGTIKIYNVTNSATPVDTIDLSQGITENATYAKNVQSRNIGGDTFTNFPVIITGNTAAVYPHLDLLASNQTYYVTVDNGTFSDSAGANFAGITATNVWKFTTKIGGPANPTNMLVAADGSGDFATVQGAVDSVTSGNTTPTLITVNNGNYVEIVNIKSKHNLTLRGQTRNGAIVGYANNANLQSSTHYRMAMKINANDIALDNLTVTNRTPAGGSQAEALTLESGARRFIFNNCTLGSYQDTFLAIGSPQSQAYMNESLVIGQFDYMWGGGVVFITNCQMLTVYGTGSSWNLIATRTDNNASGLWPAYNGLSSSNGFSFVKCFINKQSGVGIGNPTLADSNGTSNGVASWINCQIQKDYVTPSSTVLNSELLWEYGNITNDTGMPASYGLEVGLSAPALTTGDPRYLAASSATNWLYGWQPQLAPNILTNPISQTVNYGSPATFTVVATGIPDPTYQWQTNGVAIAGATSSTLTIPSATSANAGNYTVVVTTLAGSVTSTAAMLTVNPPSNTAPVFTAPIAGTNIAINIGVNLSVSCAATDSDLPAQTLTYSLLTGPGGAAVDSASGNFTWRPTVSSSGTANPVQVAVTDNGTPNLSATNSFTITVNALTSPTAGSPNYSGGQFSVSIGGQVGPDYYLQASTNLSGGTWTTVASTNSPATLPVILTDPNAGAQPIQFYRIFTGPPAP